MAAIWNLAWAGGGFCNLGIATLTDVTFSDNKALCCGGGLYNLASAKLNNVIFDGNSAKSQGGGIYIQGEWGGSVEYSKGSLANNSAFDGGGIANDSKLKVTDVTFTGNKADKFGGALNTGVSGTSWNVTANLSNVTINSNSAVMGAGIANSGGSSLVLSNSTLYDNEAISGGGLSTNGNAELNNVTLSGNKAVDTGGGIGMWAGTAKLTNVTMANNTASIGGGIRVNFGISGGKITLQNTLLANYPFGANCLAAAGATLASAGSNLSNDKTCDAFLTASGDLHDTDPLLGPLTVNPPGNTGNTSTHALLPGSPAIDSVLNLCPPPATDQRGMSRPQSKKCDIGAFEVGP
jgi:predicted outer membrane repeat protein